MTNFVLSVVSGIVLLKVHTQGRERKKERGCVCVTERERKRESERERERERDRNVVCGLWFVVCGLCVYVKGRQSVPYIPKEKFILEAAYCISSLQVQPKKVSCVEAYFDVHSFS